MAGFFDELSCGSNDDYSFLTFEFIKRKYSNCFRLDSIRRIIDDKSQEIDLYTFVSGEHFVVVSLSELGNMIAFKEDGEDYRVYKMIMIERSETGNPSLKIVVLDTDAKSYRKDLKKLRSMQDRNALLEDALKQFKSMDLVISEILR